MYIYPDVYCETELLYKKKSLIWILKSFYNTRQLYYYVKQQKIITDVGHCIRLQIDVLVRSALPIGKILLTSIASGPTPSLRANTLVVLHTCSFPTLWCAEICEVVIIIQEGGEWGGKGDKDACMHVGIFEASIINRRNKSIKMRVHHLHKLGQSVP